MEWISRRLLNIEKLNDIAQQLIEWDFSELYGIGFYRGHNKYAHIEIKVYPVKGREDRLYWNVIHDFLPNSEIESAYSELNKYVEFIANYLRVIKSDRPHLIFEITKAGFSATDDWSRASGTAFIDAFVSAFDQSKFAKAKEMSDQYFSNETEIRNVVISLNTSN